MLKKKEVKATVKILIEEVHKFLKEAKGEEVIKKIDELAALVEEGNKEAMLTIVLITIFMDMEYK